MLSRSNVLNPPIVATSLYLPGSRNRKRYRPASFATVEIATPVAMLVSCRAVPGTIEPVVSDTMPLRLARVSCAVESPARTERPKTIANRRDVGRIIDPLPKRRKNINAGAKRQCAPAFSTVKRTASVRPFPELRSPSGKSAGTAYSPPRHPRTNTSPRRISNSARPGTSSRLPRSATASDRFRSDLFRNFEALPVSPPEQLIRLRVTHARIRRRVEFQTPSDPSRSRLPRSATASGRLPSDLFRNFEALPVRPPEQLIRLRVAHARIVAASNFKLRPTRYEMFARCISAVEIAPSSIGAFRSDCFRLRTASMKFAQ